VIGAQLTSEGNIAINLTVSIVEICYNEIPENSYCQKDSLSLVELMQVLREENCSPQKGGLPSLVASSCISGF